MIARAQTLFSSGGVNIASIAFPLVIIDVRAMVAMRLRKRPSIAIVFTPVNKQVKDTPLLRTKASTEDPTQGCRAQRGNAC